MLRRAFLVAVSGVLVVLSAAPAWACAGLVAPNGGIELVRTSTLAAYVDGVEHYVTSFEFSGEGGGRFGSIVPLPGVPTDVKKGGRWTLERLALETQPPPVLEDALAFKRVGLEAAAGVDILERTRIDALKITVLSGGGDAVGEWAEKHGFSLSPDAPEVLDFYADRSPIFMAVKYDIAEAKERDLKKGDGTPVHVTIPTPNPWVPLRILGLGKQPGELIDADVYLLTEAEPNLLPQAGGDSGMTLEFNAPASGTLLRDLRSDRGMKWLPGSDMWLSYLRIDTTAGNLQHDLAIEENGLTKPSPVDAGLVIPDSSFPVPSEDIQWWPWMLAGLLAVASLVVGDRFVASRR